MDYIIVWCVLNAVVQGVTTTFCAGKSTGNYPDPEKCGGYINCFASIENKMPCPGGLHFNVKNGVCDWPEALDPPCKVQPPSPPPPAPTVCGINKQIDLGEVVGGTNAQPNRWIWQGGLYYDDQFLCGGTLIRPDTFLTAAHCVSNRDAFLMTVRMGDHQRSKIEATEQTRPVDEVIVHEGWDWSTIANDIAILKFNKEFELNDNVGTVCLPQASSTVPKDAKCYITGWGKTNVDEPNADILQEAEMPVVPNDDCKIRNANKKGESKLTENMICGGFKGPDSKVSGCRGDSGGPFVCKDKNTWFVQGVVSWGSSRCDATHRYTVFTRVSKYIDWIDTQSFPDP